MMDNVQKHICTIVKPVQNNRSLTRDLRVEPQNTKRNCYIHDSHTDFKILLWHLKFDSLNLKYLYLDDIF
jgi:hypothetical protein